MHSMEKLFLGKIFQEHQQCRQCPTKEEVSLFFDDLLGLLFPNFSNKSIETLATLLSKIRNDGKSAPRLMRSGK